MHRQQGDPRALLTALEVQQLLKVDRSTVYRMAEDGRLPALRVGRSWRFPADRIRALLAMPTPTDGSAPTATSVPVPPAPPLAFAAPTAPAPQLTALHSDVLESAAAASPGPDRLAPAADPDPAEPTLNATAALSTVQVAAELLGVMMVVTDMAGRPITDVTNQCQWFAEHADDPGVLDQCVSEWHHLAEHPDMSPRFAPGMLGFECARAFVRSGSTLVGMVLAGGVSPAETDATSAGLYDLDDEQRGRVIDALPRIAAAISTASSPTTPITRAPQSAAPRTPAPGSDATKEN